MKINKEWHAKHVMPENPTLQQRISWHLAHKENCNCRPIPPLLVAEIRKLKNK